MPTELLTIAGTLGGVVVGGLLNYLANRSMKNREWKLAVARDQAATRQKLYAEFLVEAQRLIVQAREEKVSTLADLNALNAKFAEITLIAPEDVVLAAKSLAECAISSHSSQPAKEVAELARLKTEFVTIARQDIESALSEA